MTREEQLVELVKAKNLEIEQLKQLNKSLVELTKSEARIIINFKGLVEDIKAFIPPNYPYRSNCSSPFCKFISALKNRGLD